MPMNNSAKQKRYFRHVVYSGGMVLGTELIGVLRRLQEDPALCNHIESISGTSIGSFAAVCTALNISAVEIEEAFLSNEIDLTKFFDLVWDGSVAPLSSSLPRPQVTDTHLGAAARSFYECLSLFPKLGKGIYDRASIAWNAGGLCHGNYIEKTVLALIRKQLFSLHESLLSKIDTALHDVTILAKLLADKQTYNDNCTNTEVIASLEKLIKMIPNSAAPPEEELTFEGLRQLRLLAPELHLKDVFITGTKILERGQQGVIFSYKTAPDMPLYQAVRASMGYPRVYKPVQHKGTSLVDGSVTNNTPHEIFSEDKQTKDDEILIIKFGSSRKKADAKTLPAKICNETVYIA